MLKWACLVVGSIVVGFAFAELVDCGGLPKPPSGSALCVDMTDAGPQASVSAGGITIVVPLMKLTMDASPAHE